MPYKPKEFIEEIAHDAARQCALFPGLFASLAIAQACHESNFGNSGLSKDCFNLFGIKAGSSWKGKTRTYPTKEYLNKRWVVVNEPFRKYDNFAQSIWDRNSLLNRVPTYRKNGVFAAKKPEEQAKALLKAGYATDPKYSDSLIKMIAAYNLKQFDAI